MPYIAAAYTCTRTITKSGVHEEIKGSRGKEVPPVPCLGEWKYLGLGDYADTRVISLGGTRRRWSGRGLAVGIKRGRGKALQASSRGVLGSHVMREAKRVYLYICQTHLGFRMRALRKTCLDGFLRTQRTVTPALSSLLLAFQGSAVSYNQKKSVIACTRTLSCSVECFVTATAEANS